MPAKLYRAHREGPFAARGRSYKTPPRVGAGHAREPIPNHRAGCCSRPWAAPTEAGTA